MKYPFLLLLFLASVLAESPYMTAVLADDTWVQLSDCMVVNKTTTFSVSVFTESTEVTTGLQLICPINLSEEPTEFEYEPVKNTEFILRGHVDTCLPNEGGFYYQYNTTKDSSVPENEIYGTAKTDGNGFITWNIKRPWEATTTLRSLIIHGDKNSVYEGRLICGNLKWNKDKTKDGVLSSSISLVSMLVVGLLFIMFV